MIFDKLCGMTERHSLGMDWLLREANIFDIPARPQDILEKEVPWNLEQFFLPFRAVAIEDSAGVVILYDAVKGQVGNEVSRLYIIASSSATDIDEFDWSNDSLRAGAKDSYSTGEEEISITYGILEGWLRADVDPEKSWDLVGRMYRHVICTKKRKLLDINDREDPSKYGLSAEAVEALRRESLRNAMVAVNEIYYLNQPTRFVVEISTLGQKKGKSVKIPRTQDRKKYTLLEPGKIVKILKEGGAEGSDSLPREPHWRRRHPRTFRSERFKGAKGKTVIISATWIGPTEAIVGRKHYKVRLDL